MTLQTEDPGTTYEATLCSDPGIVALAGWPGIDLNALASREGTPVHVYSADAIRDRVETLKLALQGLDVMVCYAAKANTNIAILQLMHAMGVGADIVSAGELRRCLDAGIPAKRMVFSGVGKTVEEINEGLDAGISRFNVESRDELSLLQRLSCERSVLAHAAVRINPNVDAGTHAKISTGKAENKFGVAIAEARTWFANAVELSHVRLDGLHMHIGSQILDLTPIRHALRRIADFQRELEADGHAIASINVGGGLGVRYRDGDTPITASDYVAEIRAALEGFKGRIVLEPGRYLVAEAGILLTRVIRIKQGARRNFLVVDAAMNDLLRPSLYDAWHDVVRIGGMLADPPADPSQAQRPMAHYDIVGPVCETGDTFAMARELSQCEAGDLVAIAGTGAYGATMASTYNSRPLAAEVLVDGGRYAVIRRRQTRAEMVMGEQLAGDWQVA